MTDNSYPYHISNLWEPPSRIQRLDELLRKQEKFSVEDFEQIQGDYFSYFAKETTPYILHAYDSVTVTNADIKTALSYFQNWHFQLSKDDVPSDALPCFLYPFVEEIFLNKMGEALYQKYIFIANIPYRTVPALLRNPSSWWFDDPSTPQVRNA